MAVRRIRNSDQWAFKDIELKIEGVKQATIQSITYSTSIDKAYSYGEGDQPRSIQKGNQTHQGEFSLHQTEFEALMNKSKPNEPGILDGYFNINVTYTLGDKMVRDQIIDAQVMDVNKGMNQGDYQSVHTFSFIALGIDYDGREYLSPVVKS